VLLDTVYYNPEHHSECLLCASYSWMTTDTIGIVFLPNNILWNAFDPP
jgi:hypothetical protein